MPLPIRKRGFFFKEQPYHHTVRFLVVKLSLIEIIPYMLEGGLFLSHTVGQGHSKRVSTADITICKVC